MASDYKYLGIGLAAGIGAAAIFISSIMILRAGDSPIFTTPTHTALASSPPLPDPSSKPTATTPTTWSTITPHPTLILSPTSTLTHIEYMQTTGLLNFPGSLSDDTQIRLYESSVKYIALTPDESLEMAIQINGVEYGNPANTCGPLAMAILRDAGLVSQDIIPHDFWLLNPWVVDDRNFLNATLTPEKYTYYVFHVWLKSFDWHSFPLQPGDFLYIKAGGGGNFDHMLVVNRVDSQLRAYAVTNYQRPDGFVIDEVLLYDPGDPAVGIFAAWGERQNARLGSTGFGGFELWRPKAQ